VLVGGLAARGASLLAAQAINPGHARSLIA
jgi:hypothetical protein